MKTCLTALWVGHNVGAECGISRLETPEDFLPFLLLFPYSFTLDMNKVFI